MYGPSCMRTNVVILGGAFRCKSRINTANSYLPVVPFKLLRLVQACRTFLKHKINPAAGYSFKPHRICPCVSRSKASRTGPTSFACIRIRSLSFSDSSTANSMSAFAVSSSPHPSAPVVLFNGCVAAFIERTKARWDQMSSDRHPDCDLGRSR